MVAVRKGGHCYKVIFHGGLGRIFESHYHVRALPFLAVVLRGWSLALTAGQTWPVAREMVKTKRQGAIMFNHSQKSKKKKDEAPRGRKQDPNKDTRFRKGIDLKETIGAQIDQNRTCALAKGLQNMSTFVSTTTTGSTTCLWNI